MKTSTSLLIAVLSFALLATACSPQQANDKARPANGGNPDQTGGGKPPVQGPSTPPPQAIDILARMKNGQVQFPVTLALNSNSPGSVQAGLRCLKSFILVSENDSTNLAAFLNENTDCFNARYEERNLLTFAVETNRPSVIETLLTVKNDRIKAARFFQRDGLNHSLYGFVLNNPSVYRPLFDLAWQLGLRTEMGDAGESLSSLAWATKDGEKSVSLILDHKSLPSSVCLTEEKCLIEAARAPFASFVDHYARRTGLSLRKLFNNNGNQNTLLTITSQNQYEANFSLEMHRLYLERGALVSDGQLEFGDLVGLEFMRRHLTSQSKIKDLDLFHYEIARRHPDEWAKIVKTSTSNDSVLNGLFESILTKSELPLPESVSVLIPELKPAAIWSLKGKIENVPSYGLLLEELIRKGRYPELYQLKHLTSAEPYVRGVELGFYKPDCGFFKDRGRSVQISQIDRLLKTGMAPSSCVDIDAEVQRYGADRDVVLYFSKIAKKISYPVISSFAIQDFFGLVHKAREYDLWPDVQAWLDQNRGWEMVLNSPRRPLYREFKSKLKADGLYEQFSTWLQTDAGKRLHPLVCAEIGKQEMDLNRIQALSSDYGLEPKSCFARFLPALSITDLFKVLNTNRTLALELIQELKLSRFICASKPLSEAINSTMAWKLKPNECFEAFIDQYQKIPEYYSVPESLKDQTEAYFRLFSEALSDYSADLGKVKEICSGQAKIHHLVFSALTYGLAETPGAVGTTCLKALLLTPKWPTAYIDGYMPSSSLSQSNRVLKRQLTTEEVDYLLFANRSALGLSYDEYKRFNTNFDVLNQAFLPKSMLGYLEKLSEEQIATVARRSISLLVDDFTNASKEDQKCLLGYTPRSEGGHPTFPCYEPYERRAGLGSYYKTPLKPKRSFMRTWARVLEAEVRSRKATGTLAQMLDNVLAIEIGRGMEADFKRGKSDCCGDYAEMDRSDFLRPYCRIYPKEATFNSGITNRFADMLLELTGIALSPASCQ